MFDECLIKIWSVEILCLKSNVYEMQTNTVVLSNNFDESFNQNLVCWDPLPKK